MSSPQIQYSGPPISPKVDWEIRHHLQAFYQKLGNHTQAFALLQKQIAALQPGSSSTTNIIEGPAGGGGTVSSFLGQGLINDQSGQTSYATTQGDNGILLILNDAAAVAVTLTTTGTPYYLIVTNFGAGTVTLTPSTGTINGGTSLSVLQNQTVYVACDGTNWKTTAISTVPPIVWFGIGSGVVTTNVLPYDLLAPRTGFQTQCVVRVRAADAGTALTFDIKQNGASVFSAPQTLAAGTAPGTYTLALRLGSLPVVENDAFQMSISSGTSAWQLTAQLE